VPKTKKPAPAVTEIKAENLPTGEPADRAGKSRKVTINDIARLSGVSKKTVSRVINDSPRLNPETRARVLGVIADTGYVPDPQARGLAFRRAFMIGLVYDNPNAQYIVDMQQGILDAVRGLGFELIIHPCARLSAHFQSELKHFVQRQKLLGIIMPPSVSEDDHACRILRENECDYVRIASISLDEPENMVVTNDYRGAYEAAVHLADLGHRRIAFISGPKTFRSGYERKRGFVLGLEARGLTLDPDLALEGAYTFDSGWQTAKILLAHTSPPSAIFAGNDEMAAGVIRAAYERGLTIPGDLSVVGFDDSPIASKVWPPLSSVRLPIQAMGRIAAEKLLLRAGHRLAGDATPDEVVPNLIVRQSSGPPKY
jgi:LacI family transcriptional regulator